MTVSKSTAVVALGVIAFFLVVADGSVLRFKRSSLTEDAEMMLRQSGTIEKNNVGQLIDLVARNRAEECLARVICELSHNARAHGDQGAKFAQSLLRFRSSKHPKVKYYTDAMQAGARAKSNGHCKSHYSSCTHATSEVVTVGNRILA